MTDDKGVTFEFAQNFDFVKLTHCAIDERVSSRVFVCRHHNYFFKWQLGVMPKVKSEDAETFGLFLHLVDQQQEMVTADFELFVGDEKSILGPHVGVDFKKGQTNGSGRAAFLPSVAFLTDEGLVVDGGVRLGVKVLLKLANFDPLKWLPSPPLMPNREVGLRLFNNLNTDNHLGTDFVFVVGETETELHVNRMALSVVPFFDRMFADDESKECQEGVLFLPTHTVGAVIEALRFIYVNEIDVDLTRFLPSILSLASEWQLNDLSTAIERDMVKQLLADHLNANFDLAAEYLELAADYDRKILRRVAMCKLMNAWPQFIVSSNGQNMKEQLMNEMALTMAEMSMCGGVSIS